MALTTQRLITVALLFFISHRLAIADILVDYYWRDYAGIIPEDAVIGGYDSYNRSTYIGQAFSRQYGVIPGTIVPGKITIDLPAKGAETVTSHVKILCSPRAIPFKWIPVKANEFHVKMLDKYLVLGGVEKDYVLNIGRVHYKGEVIVGKVVTQSSEADYAPIWFVSKGNEYYLKSYEALTYDPKLNVLSKTISKLSRIPLKSDKVNQNVSQGHKNLYPEI